MKELKPVFPNYISFYTAEKTYKIWFSAFRADRNFFTEKNLHNYKINGLTTGYRSEGVDREMELKNKVVNSSSRFSKVGHV